MKRVEIKNAVAVYDPLRDGPLTRKPPKLRSPREGTVYRVHPHRLDARKSDER